MWQVETWMRISNWPEWAGGGKDAGCTNETWQGEWHCLWGAENAIRKTVTIAGKLVGIALPSLENIYRDQANNIVSDLRHPFASSFEFLPSAQCYCSPKTGPNSLLFLKPSNFWTRETHTLASWPKSSLKYKESESLSTSCALCFLLIHFFSFLFVLSM